MIGNTCIAVCGKGGVGKTAISALLAKGFIKKGIRPILLVDADPADGLLLALEEKVNHTLTEARNELVKRARTANTDSDKTALSNQIDFLVFEALEERKDYSLLSIGRSAEKGCFCPANTLLREAIGNISNSFSLTLIDAEAGLEQINRQVTKNVTHYLVVIDGSARSINTLETIGSMVAKEKILVILNRSNDKPKSMINDYQIFGTIPENETLNEFDKNGKSLFLLPDDNPCVLSATNICNDFVSLCAK